MIELLPVVRAIDFRTIQTYGALTSDNNPIHTDRAFAQRSEMGRIIAHGTFSLNLILQSLENTLGSDCVRGAKLAIRFTAPVRESDVVTASGIQTEREGEFDVWVRREDGCEVIRGTVTVPRMTAASTTGQPQAQTRTEPL